MKVLIAGGGVAGLAIAWRLSQEGVSAEIVERGICGRGASWSAAGMIAPGGESTDESGILGRFARRARLDWPLFASRLEQAAGFNIGYRETGSIIVAEDEQQAQTLQSRVSGGLEWLDRDRLLQREPLLSPRLHGALHIPDDAQVDNRALCEALRSAILSVDVAIHENCEVRSLVFANGRVRAVSTSGGTIEADKIVLACGAWTNLISGADNEVPAVKPVKGQMAACVPPAGVAVPNALIWGDEAYLVPRGDRLLIGATVEDAGFDLCVERGALKKLMQSASRLIPSLPQWRLAELWSGLRPRAADGAPVLGATAIDGLYVAGGQFRNGILFAPAVAECMCAVLLGKYTGEIASAFDPRRFEVRA